MLSLRGYSNGKYIIPADDVAIPEKAEVIISWQNRQTATWRSPALTGLFVPCRI